MRVLVDALILFIIRLSLLAFKRITAQLPSHLTGLWVWKSFRYPNKLNRVPTTRHVNHPPRKKKNQAKNDSMKNKQIILFSTKKERKVKWNHKNMLFFHSNPQMTTQKYVTSSNLKSKIMTNFRLCSEYKFSDPWQKRGTKKMNKKENLRKISISTLFRMTTEY